MNEDNNQDIAAQLKKIADHLVFLEKKLDQLLDQAGNRKPYNSGFGNRDYQSQGYQGQGYRSGGYPRRPGGFRPNRHAGPQAGSFGYHPGGNRHEGNREGRPSHSAHKSSRHA